MIFLKYPAPRPTLIGEDYLQNLNNTVNVVVLDLCLKPIHLRVLDKYILAEKLREAVELPLSLNCG